MMLSVGFMNYSAMKANGEVEVQLYAFLNLAPGRGELSVSKHQLLYSQGQCSWYQMNRRLGRLQGQEGCLVEEKNLCFCQG
jgi:hypothetical protein